MSWDRDSAPVLTGETRRGAVANGRLVRYQIDVTDEGIRSPAKGGGDEVQGRRQNAGPRANATQVVQMLRMSLLQMLRAGRRSTDE